MHFKSMEQKEIAKIGVAVLLALDVAFVLYAITQGDFWADGKLILSVPWGQFTFFDIYTMFLLFDAWIFYREQNKFLAILYCILTLLLGSLFAVGYVLAVLLRTDLDEFWNGTASHVRLSDE